MKKKNTKNETISIFIISFSLLYIFAFIFTDKMGIIGRIMVQTTTRNIGLGAYIFPFLLLFGGMVILLDFKLPNPYHKFFGIGFLFIIFLVFIHLRLLSLDHSYLLAKNGAGGGLLGYYFANSLYLYFGTRGAYLVLISLSLISTLFITEVSYFYIFSNLIKSIKIISHNFYNLLKNIGVKIYKSSKYKEVTDDQEYKINKVSKKIFKEKKKENELKLKEEIIVNKDYPESKISKYQIPPLSLLSDPHSEEKIDTKLNIEKNIKILESTFSNFGIDAKVVGVIQGPTVTRYEIHPAPGVKISKITILSNDIALAFAVASVRIEAPIPGKNAVGIEVPNQKRINVYLKEILQSNEFKNSKFKLLIGLGIDIGGKPIIADLIELPHLLIAGATGSGKSVCINNIILSIIYNLSPEKVKFIMIDPKRVELNIYNGIPHLLIPIITDTNQAIKVLNWVISEMEKRFKIFAEVGVRNLEGYNEYARNLKNDINALPYIIIIIDELADLMLSSPVKAEEVLCRLAQMTRATGIHLIIATQRPSVDIITGSIKINFPSRIAFAVSTQVDSRTILDVNGAEKLLGNGDMLFSPVGVSKPIRAQGAFVTEKEIKNIVSYLKEYGQSPEYEQEVLEFKNNKNLFIATEEEEEEEEDELFNEAISIINNNKQASISILQRKLRIGYTRAARLIDLMEERGIVGPYDGRNPRKILLSEDEYLNNFEKQ